MSDLDKKLLEKTKVHHKKLLARLKARVSASSSTFAAPLVEVSNPSVKHAQLDFLSWKHGSIYTKTSVHTLVFSNFIEGETALNNQHLTGLADFSKHVMEKDIERARSKERRFEHFQIPFVFNAKPSVKKSMLPLLPWAVNNASDSTNECVNQALLDKMNSANYPYSLVNDGYTGVPTASSSGFSTSDRATSSAYEIFTTQKLLSLDSQAGDVGSISDIIGSFDDASSNPDENERKASGRIESIKREMNTILATINSSDYYIDSAFQTDIDVLSNNSHAASSFANRSVTVVYQSQSEYVDILDLRQIKRDYRETIDVIEQQLKARIEHCEYVINEYEDSNKTNTIDFEDQIDDQYEGRLKTIKNVNIADCRLQLGTAIHKYATQRLGTSGGNKYNSLEASDILALSDATSLSATGMQAINTYVNLPVARSFFSGAPLAYIFAVGSPGLGDFAYPISKERRLANAAVYLNDMLIQSSQNDNTSRLSVAHTRFAQQYRKLFNVNRLWAYSVGMHDEYPRFEESGLGKLSMRYETWFSDALRDDDTMSRFGYHKLAADNAMELPLYVNKGSGFWVEANADFKSNSYKPDTYYWYAKDDLTYIQSNKNKLYPLCLRLFLLGYQAPIDIYYVSFETDAYYMLSGGEIIYSNDHLLTVSLMSL